MLLYDLNLELSYITILYIQDLEEGRYDKS